MARRQVFHSSPGGSAGWKVTQSGTTLSNHRTQKAAEKAATARGRAAENAGGLGQAVLHKGNGEIKEERTYGQDPPKRPG